MVLLLWLAFIYLPFAMPSWRAFLALCTVYLLIGLGVRYGVATYTAAQVPAILVAIGNFWIDLVVQVLPIPIIARAIVLAAKSLGLGGRRLLALNVMAMLALPATALAIDQYWRWERRPASEDCTAKPIPLMLMGVAGSVPWNNAISLYLGPDTSEDARYLLAPRHRRTVCRETSDGSERLVISALSVTSDRAGPDRCLASDIRPWELALCAKPEDPDAGAFPNAVTFFDPNGIQLGDFGIPGAATNDASPLADDQRLVSVANPEFGRITAVCRAPWGRSRLITCQMRRPILDGISVYWELTLPADAIDAGLLQAEAFSRSICFSIFNVPGCAAPPRKSP